MSAGEGWGSERFDGITFGDGARWGIALLVVLAAGFGVANTVRSLPTPALTVGEPEPVILLDLAPVVPVEQATPEVAEVLPPEPAEPVEELPPETAQPVEELPPEVVEPVETVQPETVQPDVVKPELQTAELPEQVEPLAEQPPEPVEPLPQEIVEPEPVEQMAGVEEEPVPALPPDEVLAAEPDVPMPVAISPRLQAQRENTAALPPPVRRQPAPRAPAATPPPARQQASAPAAPAASAVSPQQWQAQALALLDRRKVYPQQAQNDGIEGSVDVSFSVSASGQLGSIRISRSSGSGVLDQAALDTARRASPLPPPPADIAGATLTATVRFSLR
ncbi:outer membrane transport energization protein TonB [Devosia sp. YR412]|uniref:energy transducer TonB family protein n=1 Tax=Devosia sp. YR412 TaxID=1881030 RepID=UPI0008B59A94|nr:energy transducer TonB [Devosia sp. YR412]SEQ60248.1 outer membrane transport energization protein TonB [Devosia sp. YR412]